MKHIDKVFREKLYHQKAPVPDGMWDKIAPAIEDNSGRSILWFWFGGVLALLLAGLGYVLFTNSGSVTSTPLALEANKSNSLDLVATHSNLEPVDTELSATPKTKKEVLPIVNTTNTPPKKTNTNKATEEKATKAKTSSVKVSNTKVDRKPSKAITTVAARNTNTDNLYGKPANLVITKSYISEKGSFIEQSNTSNENSETAPSYNVFINSEGLNAGALLRVVEPLENIPLPAFTKTLKKKVTL